MKRNYTNPERIVVMSLRLTQDQYERLTARARAEERSYSAQARFLIDKGLAADELPEEAA